MRRFFFSLVCLLFSASLFSQELSQNLESYQLTVSGENIILSGYKPLSKGQVFTAYFCDQSLNVITTYTKTLPLETKNFFVAKSGDLFVFSFYTVGEKVKYKIALDGAFTEKYAAVPKAEAESDDVIISDWTYDATYANEYVIGDLMLDAQLDAITCYSLKDPVQGSYKLKWKKEFDDKIYYKKMELIGINERIAYFQAVELLPECKQLFFSINIDDGDVLFNTELNKADSLDAVSVSSFFVKGNTIYLGGTFSRSEGAKYDFKPTILDNMDNLRRGFDESSPYIIAATDGYFLMTIDAKSGAIQKMKTFNFPPIDKVVDDRDYRLAVCLGIATLSDGKMVAFYELLSTSFSGITIGSMGSGSNVGGMLKWETDGFTSLIFSSDMSTFDPTTLVWDEETSDYDLTDYDFFSLAPMQEVPHDYCTLGNDGCYPEAFTCDGTNWVFHLRSDDKLIPDYLIRGNESEMKPLKLLPPGLVLLRDVHTGIQIKEAGQSVKVKIVTVN
ncbi:hypothetical protein BH11BAC7_BH11BAC7_07540 [soil metagenome]